MGQLVPKPLLLVLLLLSVVTDAFLTKSRHSLVERSTTSRWMGLSSEEDAEEEEFSLTNQQNDDLDSQRQRLESLLGWTQQQDKSNGLSSWEDQRKQPPPLTSIGRERARLEIALLESLQTSDTAIPRLWQLWYHARGPAAAQALELADFAMQTQPELAERQLRDLIAQEGIHFVEAVNRLATLLFLQNRLEESKELCQIILDIKPWHFGALSGICMICQQQNDIKGLQHWKQQSMPSLQSSVSTTTSSRSEWVQRMVQEAQKRLNQHGRAVEDDNSPHREQDGGILKNDNDDNSTTAWQ